MSGHWPTIPAPPAPVTVSSREPSIPPSEHYTGEVGACRRFLLQCSLVFDQKPSAFLTDRAKLAYAVNILRGKASEWAHSLWEAGSPLLDSFEVFLYRDA